MRISDFNFRSLMVRELQARASALAGADRRSATGHLIDTPADASGDAARVVRYEGQLRDFDAYRRAGVSAGTRLSIEESVIRSARDLVQQVKHLAASVANTNPGDPLRQSVDAAIDQIQQQLVALGNTKVGDEYLFAGGKTNSPPFLLDGTYVGDATVRKATIDDGLTVDTTHTGQDLLGSTFAALAGLKLQVQTGSPAQLQSASTTLDSASQDLLTKEAEVGARQQAVTAAAGSLARRSTDLQNTRDALAEADPSQAAVELVQSQNALQQAYAAVSKVLGTSILNFLN